jgi:hypothetical protein
MVDYVDGRKSTQDMLEDYLKYLDTTASQLNFRELQSSNTMEFVRGHMKRGRK